jgi:chromosome partitioning protein
VPVELQCSRSDATGALRLRAGDTDRVVPSTRSAVKIVAVINQKGGVGKTTTTVNLGAGLAQMGRNVLLLDLDPQANLSLHLDRRPELEEATMTHLLVEDRPIAELIRTTPTERLFVIPADTSLGGVEQVLANKIGRETVLREALDAYRGEPQFDYVLIDCPPSLGVLSANALCAASEVLIPMQTEYFSLQGMAKLTEVIQVVKRRLNPAIDVTCVLPCMVDLRTRLTTEVIENIGAYFGDRLAKTWIRNNVKLAEAPSFGMTIFQHAPDSNGAADYRAFTLEFLARHGDLPAAMVEPADVSAADAPNAHSVPAERSIGTSRDDDPPDHRASSSSERSSLGAADSPQDSMAAGSD